MRWLLLDLAEHFPLSYLAPQREATSLQWRILEALQQTMGLLPSRFLPIERRASPVGIANTQGRAGHAQTYTLGDTV